MTSVSYTLFFAGCCALLQCLLTVLVIMRRAQTGVNFLDGGDDQLLRRMRAHGNFAETVPMALLLMLLLELRGLSSLWLIGFGIALLLGRILNAQGLLFPNAFWSRKAGMGLTIAVISIQGAWAIALFLR
jgi:hypothetical protein